MHYDAGEFREPPWPGGSLREEIRWVDELGYNEIEIRVLNFPPVDNGFIPGRTSCAGKEPDEYDRIQRKCWKAGAADVVLAHGGHEVHLTCRRVFPTQFLSRRYPIWSQSHGERKLFGKRKGRFSEDEIAYGCHRQYDGIEERHSFFRNPATIRPFDASVRLATLAAADLDVDSRSSEPSLQDTTEVEGALDRVDDRRINGWARAKFAPAEPVDVNTSTQLVWCEYSRTLFLPDFVIELLEDAGSRMRVKSATRRPPVPIRKSSRSTTALRRAFSSRQ